MPLRQESVGSLRKNPFGLRAGQRVVESLLLYEDAAGKRRLAFWLDVKDVEARCSTGISGNQDQRIWFCEKGRA